MVVVIVIVVVVVAVVKVGSLNSDASRIFFSKLRSLASELFKTVRTLLDLFSHSHAFTGNISHNLSRGITGPILSYTLFGIFLTLAPQTHFPSLSHAHTHTRASLSPSLSRTRTHEGV